MKRRDFSIIIANILDKYDTSVFSFLAPVLAPLFFPHQDLLVQLICMYATSLTSFVARPCGAFLFGMYAFHYGPAQSLSLSLMGVGITTMIIGCIPTYECIGWYAPLILVFIRFVRGICAAGESTVAKLYIMENKTDYEALRASYWYQSSTMMGTILASGCAAGVISLNLYLWRWFFVCGGVISLIALYMRRMNDVTQQSAYDVAYQGYTCNGIRMLWRERVNVICVALATIFSHMTYSVPFVFMNSFVPLITDISLPTMMKYNTMLLFFDMVSVPAIGYVTRYWIARYVMMCASSVLVCTIIPLFYGLPGASLWYVLCVRVWIVLWGVVFLCPLTFWCKQLFKKEDAYFLVGMGNALGSATLGHATTPVCLWLWYVTGSVYAPAIYMTCIMGIVVWVVSGTIIKKRL